MSAKTRAPKASQAAKGPASSTPAGFSTVLLAVTGESPAILTETVWALAQERTLPSRIVVVTTTTGARRIREELLAPSSQFAGRSPWEALRADLLHLHPEARSLLVFDPIRIITAESSPTGTALELDDLRTRDDNAAAANFILEQVRAFTANPDTRLIASIAGGRKTMGALLYAALTLLGRESDRITHVLVNAPFDQRLDPPFYFPTSKPSVHVLNRRGLDEKTHSSSAARIDLADIPFVPLRNGFDELKSTPGSFATLVTRYSRDLLHRADHVPTLALDERKPAILIDGRIIPLPAKAGSPRLQLAILATLLAVQPHLPADGKIDPESFAQIVKAHHGYSDGLNLNTHSQKTARGIAAVLHGQAPTERIQDFLLKLDARMVTRTLSEFRKILKTEHGLVWLAKKGSLRLPAIRIGS